eukprot:Gb_01653 [translate_table: standard]
MFLLQFAVVFEEVKLPRSSCYAIYRQA